MNAKRLAEIEAMLEWDVDVSDEYARGFGEAVEAAKELSALRALVREVDAVGSLRAHTNCHCKTCEPGHRLRAAVKGRAMDDLVKNDPVEDE